MKIGFVYDLRDDYRGLGLPEETIAEFDSTETIAAIERTLQHLGFEVDRIGHIKRLVERLSHGERWDFVFNIAEGLYGSGREAAVPALLDAYHIPYAFSGPVTMAMTLDKSLAKRIVRDAGIPTAPFALVALETDIKAIDLPYPLFVKPLAEGTGKGISSASHIENATVLTARCRELLQRFHQPVLVETYLPGREFTVGITGSGMEAQVIGVLEVILKDTAEPYAHSYDNKEQCETHVAYVLATDAEAERAASVALQAWRVLDCKDGGRIDVRSDVEGQPHFLEANPLSGLHPTHSDLPILATQAGIAYDGLMETMLRSAFRRYGLTWPETLREASYATYG